VTALSTPGTRVVLMGTGTHDTAPDIPNVGAVPATVDRLGRVLVERCGLDPRHLTTVLDQATPELGGALAEQAEQAEDVLLVYYVGHGLVSLSGELYLASRITDRRPNRLGITALPYSQVRNCVLESRASTSVVILDCCFSGRAIGALGDPVADVTAMAHISGTYVLTSSGREEVALAPPGADYTAFTGELISLLCDGIPRGPKDLTLRDISRYLSRVLPAKGLPKPRYEAREGAEDLVLAGNPAYRAAEPPAETPPPVERGQDCPYPGLASFQEEQARWFFGRERATKELLVRLTERMDGIGPLVVAGPSGAGKSSLLRAGLLPAFRRGNFSVPGARSWPRLLFTPTAQPDQKLADLVAGRVGKDPGAVLERLESDPACLAELLHTALSEEREGHAQPGDLARVLIVVDQFEETFTLCADEHRRRLFIRALCAASTSTDEHPAPALVVLGMRADLLGNCARYPELVDALRYGQVMLGAMTTPELRDVIEKPARAVGLTLEAGLADLIIGEFDDEETRVGEATYHPARLPLLSHALHATWEQRQDGVLTIEGYRDTGGISGAIRTTADETYQRLSPEEQRVARQILLHLIKVGEDTEPTRQRVALDRLAAESGNPAAATAVLSALERARLVTVDKTNAEITHEALLREWPLFRDWIDADRAGLLIRQRLTAATQRWLEGKRDADFLYPAGRLAEVSSWEQEHGSVVAFDQAENEFLAESRVKRDRDRRRRRVAVAWLGVLAVLAVVASLVAAWQWNSATDQRDSASARGLVAQAEGVRSSSPQLALRLGLAAQHVYPSAETNASLVTTLLTTHYAGALTGSGRIVPAVAYAPRGNIVATGSENGTTTLWEVTAPDRPVRLGEPLDDRTNNTVTSLSFSPNGNTLAIGSSGGVTTLWDVADPRRPDRVEQLDDGAPAVTSVSFSPTGKTLVAGSSVGVATLWDITDPARARKLGQPLSGHNSRVASVAFSPNGNTLATGSDDGTTILWEVGDPGRPARLGQPLRDGTGTVTSVSFSPNGNILATGGSIGTVSLWDVTAPAAARSTGKPVSGHSGLVSSVTFAPDGQRLITGSEDGTAILWDVSDPAEPVQDLPPLMGHRGRVSSVAFAPDGSTVVTGSDDGTAILWELTTRPRQLSPPLTGHHNQVSSLRFEGSTLITASPNDKEIRWDLTDPAKPRQVAESRRGLSDRVASLATRPDAPVDATVAPDNSVILWDIRDPRTPHQLGPALTGHSSLVSSGVFSPDGNLLAAGTADGSVVIWDVHDPAVPQRLGQLPSGHRKPISSVAFAPDGNTLATGSADHTVILWDLTDPRTPFRLGQPLTGHTQSVRSLAFAPDGRVLASGSADKTVLLWDLTLLTRATEQACSVADGGLSPDEWARHLPDLSYQDTC
jgi:WD40 repeat protein